MSYYKSSYTKRASYAKPYSSTKRYPAYKRYKPASRYTRAAPPQRRWDQIPTAAVASKDTVRLKFSDTQNVNVNAAGYTSLYLSAVNPGAVNPAGDVAFGFPEALAGYSRYYVSGAKFTLRILPNSQFNLETKLVCDTMHPAATPLTYMHKPNCKTSLYASESTSATSLVLKYSAKHFHGIDVANNPAIIGSVDAPPTSTVAFMAFMKLLAQPQNEITITVQYEVEYFLCLGARIN